MRDVVQVGLGKQARRAYDLADVSLVPSRRTRDVDEVSTAWRIDAFGFDIPLVANPSDATMSPDMVVEVGRQGGLGVLNAEGLWTRYEDPRPAYDEIAALGGGDATPGEEVAALQRIYAAPVQPELIAARIKEISAAGVTTAVRLSPQRTLELAPTVLSAGVDLLVIQGTIVSAEHVGNGGAALNLKRFIAELDVPVIVGGCENYQTALHLMRTGAAGVIVGSTDGGGATTREVLGIGVPLATAIADAAAARRDYLDETGGRYVHVIADGDLRSSGEVALAHACGADATMLGYLLAPAQESPSGGHWWQSAAAHPSLPRGFVLGPWQHTSPLRKILYGPAEDPDGTENVFGALRRAMAKCGYHDLKEFQKVELVVR